MRCKLGVCLPAAAAVLVLFLFIRPASHWTERQRSVPEPGAVGSVEFADPPPKPSTQVEKPSTPPSASPAPPLTQSSWEKPNAAPVFTAFQEWARRYGAAGSSEAKAALEAEGVILARARRQALADLIQSDPEQAIAATVPHAVRAGLPASITSLLEERVNAIGNYEVMGFVPLPGHEQEIAPVLRYAVVHGERHQVFTYGKGLEYVTRANVPLNGIRVPHEAATLEAPANGQPRAGFLMALHPNPARRLEPSEVAALRNSFRQQPNCPTSGDPWTKNSEPAAEEVGGKILTFCGQVHAQDWATAALVSAALETPAPPANLPTSESSYTEGRKRMLLMRPIFSDYTGGMTTNDALGHFQNFSNYMWQMSYGKLVLAPFRQGSDVTPEMLLPGAAADYDNQGLSKLYPTCIDVARTNYNYDTGQYDFLYVCTASRPAASYAGLAYVGGVGFHLANSSWGASVSSHEFGHNLGLNHAHFWNTQARSVIGTGQNVEYGDNNDPMGGGGNPNSYNSRYKNYLGWIPNTDIADLNVTGSGRYRLYCFDLDEGIGLRGLKFTRNGSQNYWVNFRQRKTNKPALMNGVQLLWTGNGNQGSYLLDVRLKGDADDNAIVIGRTFSDPAIGFHVTPVGKGNTYPESMDVVVHIGPFPANQPPTAAVAASAVNVTPGQAVTFTAQANDPNGDALAYYWDFGDGDYSIDNHAVTSHAFATAGEYAAQCTVSDMKGGTVRRTVIIRVGNPATFRISGRVLDKNSRPLAGIRVSTDSGESVFSDSDGSYTLAGLAAGSYLLEAVEAVSGSLSFTHPFFNNPVTVGPSFAGADFIGVTGSLNIYTPLLAKGAAGWRYFDDGTNQGTAWRGPGFNDSTWSTGTAPLGYPAGSPISTVVSYGPNSSAKYITTYFRRQFNVPDPGAFTNLLLEVLRDDGVIVYLNGTEVFRDNMPASGVTYSTFANDAVEPDSYLSSALSATLLVPGVNTIAAEIHQATLSSSDIALDVGLSGLSVSNASGFNLVYISSPADGAVLSNSTDIVVTARALSGSDPVNSVAFFADGVSLGGAASAPYQVTWSSPPDGPHTLQAIATIGSMQVTSAPVRISVSAPVTPVQTTSLTLVPTNATWRYLANGAPPPSAWAEPAFNDTSWPAGAAQLGYGENDEATTVPFGSSNNKWITTYFRHPFTVNDPGLITNLSVRLLRDDGGIVYLNGVEVFRSNMPNGPVTHLTLANNAADDGKTIFGAAVDPSHLTQGTNVVAVEIHQDSVTSSDVSFALGLQAEVVVLPRGVYLTAPANESGYVVPTNVILRANASAGGALDITSVEFFADDTSVGVDALAPYAVSLTETSPGVRQITAVATDSAGAAITSAPVNISLLAPAIGTALISFGDVWKYLDDGSQPGSNWTARAFDDRLWNNGPARLGYGGDGERTTVNFGRNSNAKFITTWFRKAVTVPDPAVFDGLLLRLWRDDGAVVYLNGAEIYRDNIQPGLVSWNSLATAAVEGPAEQAPVDVRLGTAGLLAGTNVIAVEVHQASLASPDLGFDLALIGLQDTNTSEGIYVTSPADGAHFNGPASIPLSAYAIASEPITLVEYFEGATKIGEAVAPGFSATWNGATVGTYSLTARAAYGAGSMLTSAPVTVVVGEPPAPVAPVFANLIPARSPWRYWDHVAVSNGWPQTEFNDAAWPNGLARLGFGLDGEITPLNEGRTSYYFRRWFNIANPALLNQLVFGLARDDGAVVYLNGMEVFRSNMPDGPITSATTALTTVNTPDETTYFETILPSAGSGLLVGANLVAVEVHQASPNSSDVGFDLQLAGYGNTEARVVLAQPASSGFYRLGEQIPLQAFVWNAGPVVVTNVEFFVGGQKLSQTASTPYQATFTGTDYGAYVLAACATFSDGTKIDSDPVTISVSHDPAVTTLVASNSVWKYLDTGANLGTAWTQTNYVETGWKSGAARLGYGDDGEVTGVSFGPSSSSKYITTYFRRSVVIPPGFIYTNLTFRLVRDDGAVVWLNGRELYRSNMPDPPTIITSATRASNAVGNADEQTFFVTVLPVPALPAGTNVFAVEVHQSAANSSDLGFNLEVVGSGYIESDPQPTLSIRFDDQMVELSWPASAVGWQVFTAPTATTPGNAWTPLGGTPTLVSGRYFIAVPPTLGQQFFRLGRP